MLTKAKQFKLLDPSTDCGTRRTFGAGVKADSCNHSMPELGAGGRGFKAMVSYKASMRQAWDKSLCLRGRGKNKTKKKTENE